MQTITSINTLKPLKSTRVLNRQRGFTLSVALIALAAFIVAIGFAFHSVHQSANRLHARIQGAVPPVFDTVPQNEENRDIIVDVEKGKFVELPPKSRQARIEAAVDGR